MEEPSECATPKREEEEESAVVRGRRSAAKRPAVPVRAFQRPLVVGDQAFSGV